MKHLLRRFFAHTSFHRELYYLPLVVLGFCLAAIYFVNWVTGRPVADDPGILVGYAFNAIGVSIVLPRDFDDTADVKPAPGAEKPNPKFLDDVFDAWVTLCLLVLYSVLVFSLLR